jgi:conjugal transfer/type IV secretion protein DotA/TraY
MSNSFISLPNVSRKDVLHYLFLPQILPRLKEFSLNTHYIAYLMALIFAMTRLLPQSHPYLMASNMGQFGIRDVFTAAKQNLKFDIHHIDHVIIFGSMALGIFIFCCLIAILVFLLFTQAAYAGTGLLPNDWMRGGIFTTPYPKLDLALEMLDKTFQVPGMFGSQYDPVTWEKVTPFGKGLHAIFAFFSYGMLAIGGMIVFYYSVALVLESAQTGTPFGKRFADYYAPIRLVIALLLLVPMAGGLSAGQYTTLYIAKLGSGLATNSWLLFNEKIGQTPNSEIIANPRTPPIDDLLRYMTIVQSCKAMYDLQYTGDQKKNIQPYILKFPQNGKPAEVIPVTSTMSFTDALNASGITDNIHIIFGDKKDAYTKAMANVRPYCGHMRLSLTHYDQPITASIKQIQFKLLIEMWNYQPLIDVGKNWATNFNNNTDFTMGNSEAMQIASHFEAYFQSKMTAAIASIRNSPTIIVPIQQEILDRGWGGAGLWFNKIAESNGALMSSAMQTLQPVAFPILMQHSLFMKRMLNPGMDTLSRYAPQFAGNMSVPEIFAMAKLDDAVTDAKIAEFLGKAFDDLEDNALYSKRKRQDINPITGLINLIFGTEALFLLRENQEVHPLAKMSALGKGILDRALMYLGGSMAMSGIGGFLSVTIDAYGAPNDGSKGNIQFGEAFDQFSNAMMAFAMVGITVGFVLYYVIPLLPFMYFFFAVGRWVKGIFEALVCIPLWALAHLRIDGNGIPGKAAANGYFILLELFLRPILTLFGLMAAISIFSAQAIVMEMVFDTVVGNLGGHQTIDQGQKDIPIPTANDIDQFFYSIVYAVLIYIMALASFKLIDLIPNSIMRFMGSNVGAFSDKTAFEAEQTIQLTGIGGYQMVDDVAKAGQNAAKAAGEAPGVVTLPAIHEMKAAQDRAAAAARQGGGADSPATPTAPTNPSGGGQ